MYASVCNNALLDHNKRTRKSDLAKDTISYCSLACLFNTLNIWEVSQSVYSANLAACAYWPVGDLECREMPYIPSVGANEGVFNSSEVWGRLWRVGGLLLY